jgi:WD40-like Beta Propeller Repeat
MRSSAESFAFQCLARSSLLIGLLAAACGEPLRDSDYEGTPAVRMRLGSLPESVEAGAHGYVLWMRWNGVVRRHDGIQSRTHNGIVERSTHAYFSRERIVHVPRSQFIVESPEIQFFRVTVSDDLNGHAWPSTTVAATFQYLLVHVRDDHGPHAPLPLYFGGRRTDTKLPVGYHLVRRSCSPTAPFQVEVVPPDTLVTLDAFTPTSEADSRVQFEERILTPCGILPTPASQGTLVSDLAANSLALGPAGDAVYLLRLPTMLPTPSAPRLDFWSPASGGGTTVAFGGFTGGLQVARDGRVFVDVLEDASPKTAEITPPAMGQSWRKRTLPVAAGALLSPDGRRLAFASGAPNMEEVAIYDVDTGAQMRLGRGTPRAWSPSGEHLLVGSPGDGDQHSIVDMQGAVRELPRLVSGFAARERFDRKYAWSPSEGPLLVERRGNVPLDQLDSFPHTPLPAGVPAPAYDQAVRLNLAGQLGVTALETGADRPLLTSEDGPISESWVLSPDGSRLFAFNLNCAGFAVEYCGADLHRVNISDGARAHVARLPQAGTLAPSHDGRRVAVAGSKEVFLLEAP